MINKSLRRDLSVLLLLLAIANNFTLHAQESTKKDHWRPLFNGKNLDGWSVKITGYPLHENFGNTFRVENGVLKASYDRYQKFDNRFGHLFYKEKFSHYRLRVEYRFTGEQCVGGPDWALRNSGVMVHSQSAQSMALKQEFPVSIEVQFLGGDGKNERHTVNLCTPGTNVVMGDSLVTQHCFDSRSQTYHGEQWVTAEVEVRGNEVIKHFINGELVFEYQKPQLDERDAEARQFITDGKLMLHEGYLALQAESHPIEFRKVEILVLPKN